jgi:hypothetical protein
MLFQNDIESFFGGIEAKIRKSYEDKKIEQFPVLKSEVVVPWFIAQQKNYPNAAVGVLIRFRAVQEHQAGKSFRKPLFSTMEKGYIQLLLDNQDREVLDSYGKLVMRYFEAEKEDSEVQKQFGSKNMIRYE